MRELQRNDIKFALLFFAAILSLACINIEEGTDINSLPQPLRDRVCKESSKIQSVDAISTIVTPTRKLSESAIPRFTDDMDFDNMIVAIDRQIVRFKQRNLKNNIRFGSDTYKQTVLLESIQVFKEIVLQTQECLSQTESTPAKQLCYQKMDQEVRQSYNVYAPKLNNKDPRYGEDKDTFFTAYYSPTLEAQKKSDSRFRYPIYLRPSTESLAKSSRNQIDFKGKIANRGYELYYTDDLFDIYLMQVQGSGRVRFESNEDQWVSYGGTNSQRWRFISTYMKSKGYIDDLSIYAQIEYLNQNPHKHEEIYSTCPSYVYFRPTSHPPTGSDSVSVTNGRSIATDTDFYPRKGTLAFIQAMRPKEGQEDKDPRKNPVEFKEFSRFVLDQDTGGAINGKARVDIYQGDDDYARQAAYNTQHTGNLYFLVLKK